MGLGFISFSGSMGYATTNGRVVCLVGEVRMLVSAAWKFRSRFL